mmetsp:Transcript_48686/g.83116  ORF Transcript_48686/g.83116 Transcript_48686/m.83116 type:complete len:281 (-) Transcript_48686:76-918(-)
MAALDQGGSGGGGGGIVKAFRTSAAAAKEKWSEEVKVTQAKKDAPGFPYPMAVSRAIPRPEAAKSWEVWELKIKLILQSKPVSPGDPADLKVEVSTDDSSLPTRASEGMAAVVTKQWLKFQKRATAKADAGEKYVFCCSEAFEWAASNFVEILSSQPIFVSRFIAEAATGGNEWHYCLQEPTGPPKEEVLTEEEKEAARVAEIEHQARRIEEEYQRQIALTERAAERREMQDELGGPKVRQLSKKEKEEAADVKRGQGNRTAKTGAKSHKPVKDTEKDKK